MVALKAAPLPRLLKALGPECRAVLVYGPDAGLVAERASTLANHFGSGEAGTAEIVRLDDRDLAEDAGRLEVELRTIPMFADRKVVRLSAGARLDVPSLRALLNSSLASTLIIEAGALRADQALRKLFEAHATAAAIACYGDERTIPDLIDEELKRGGLKIDSDSRAYLAARLGADQALSRAEIAKLALYAAGKGSVEAEDIDAVVGDSAEIAVENFVYDVSAGDTKQALRELHRLAAGGTDAQTALTALGRHFTQLYRVAAVQASGGTVEQAIRQLRPRPHFKRERAFIAHSKRLGARRLLEALPLIQDAVRRARLNTELEHAFAERLVLTLTA